MLDKRITIINVYGPSAGDSPQFLEKVFNLIHDLENKTLIFGGVWTCLFKLAIDGRSYTGNPLRPISRTKMSTQSFYNSDKD